VLQPGTYTGRWRETLTMVISRMKMSETECHSDTFIAEFEHRYLVIASFFGRQSVRGTAAGRPQRWRSWFSVSVQRLAAHCPNFS